MRPEERLTGCSPDYLVRHSGILSKAARKQRMLQRDHGPSRMFMSETGYFCAMDRGACSFSSYSARHSLDERNCDILTRWFRRGHLERAVYIFVRKIEPVYVPGQALSGGEGVKNYFPGALWLKYCWVSFHDVYSVGLNRIHSE